MVTRHGVFPVNAVCQACARNVACFCCATHDLCASPCRLSSCDWLGAAYFFCSRPVSVLNCSSSYSKLRKPTIAGRLGREDGARLR